MFQMHLIAFTNIKSGLTCNVLGIDVNIIRYTHCIVYFQPHSFVRFFIYFNRTDMWCNTTILKSINSKTKIMRSISKF